MKTMHSTAVGFAIALGLSFTAIGQTGAPIGNNPNNGTSVESTSATNSATGDRVPANRPDDPIKACANVLAAEMEPCIARQNARRSGTANAGSTTRPTQGATSGSNSANSADTATGKTK